jgi:hypothetical protein
VSQPDGRTSDSRRLRELLAEVDVPLGTLRRDPSGDTWLPTQVREASSIDDGIRDDVARFVEGERHLRLDADVGTDPLFTARVLQSLPARPEGTGLSPRQRLAILAGSYAAAALVGWVVVGALASETFVTWADAAQGWIESADAAPGTAIALATAALAVVFFALRPDLSSRSSSRPDTPAA